MKTQKYVLLSHRANPSPEKRRRLRTLLSYGYDWQDFVCFISIFWWFDIGRRGSYFGAFD